LNIRYLFILIYAATALIAILAIPSYEEAGMQAFEDPSDITNSLYYFGAILGFTAVILIIARYRENLLYVMMYLLILISIYYVFIPFLGNVSVVPSLIIVILLLKRSNWLVINIAALLLAAGITSIFGISLEPLPVIVLMVILAIYDAISVYKTKHMISLAESVTKLKLPMLFIIPYSRKFKLEDLKDARGKASFMGVGDAVIPNILVVSAQMFSASGYIGFIKISALFTLIGGIIGLFVLLSLMDRKAGAHPGLPFLNSGAIGGYVFSMFL
jgi:presenilin-like A22 family membrane protease